MIAYKMVRGNVALKYGSRYLSNISNFSKSAKIGIVGMGHVGVYEFQNIFIFYKLTFLKMLQELLLQTTS